MAIEHKLGYGRSGGRGTGLSEASASVTSRIDAAIVSVILALAALPTSLARAQTTSRFELEWSVPAGCLDRESARAAIDDALDASGAAYHAPAVVRVTITEASSGRWNADIWMYDATGSGERSFEGTSCEQVAQAAALIVALAIATAPEIEPADAKMPRSPERAATSGAADRVRVTAGARWLGDLGSLPEPDLGLGIVVSLQYRRARAEGDASAWLPRTARDGLVADSGGRFSLYAGALRGCIDLLRSAGDAALTLGPCAGAEAGVMVGRGFGLAVRRAKGVFWGAGFLGLSARYLGAAPLWMGFLGELGLPFHRAAWQVDDVRTVFRPAPVVARVALGVGWLFP
jgi:hypothetical protein